MNEELFKEDRNLSACETVIMKVIWDSEEDIAVPKLIEELRDKYGKDYARTTVATFLLKLSEKDFVRTYRKGKLSYVRALKSEEDYKIKLLQEETDFWYQGHAASLMSALCKAKKLTKEDVDSIRRMLDELDD